MASGNDHKVYTPEQARLILAKALHERITQYAGVLETLQKREGDRETCPDCGFTHRADGTVLSTGGPGKVACQRHLQNSPVAGKKNKKPELSKALTERISGYADVLAELQKREGSTALEPIGNEHPSVCNSGTCTKKAKFIKDGKPICRDCAMAQAGAEASKRLGKALSGGGAGGGAPSAAVGPAALGKVAPPGREEQVRALKPKVGTASAFKIAWASYNHGKETRKNMTGGSENMSSGTPGLMMGEHSMEKAPAPAEGADAGWDQPSTNMAMGEPHPENLREKQSVPVKTDDPRSNNFVTAGNNQSTLKAEPKDLQGKTDGRHQPLIHVGHRQQGTLAGDAKPTDHPHGIASGNIHPTGLPPGGKSPSNHNIEKADVPMAKPPSGNPTAAGAKPPQSHPSGGGMATPKLPGPGGMQKGLGGIMAGAGAGAAQGMQAAHASSAGNAQSVVAGGVLGGLKGAMGAAFAKKPAASAAAPAMAKAGEGALRPAAGGLAAGAQNAAHAAGAPAAAPKPQPSQAQHAARAEGLQSFMPAGKFTPAGGAPAAAPGGAAKPAAPAAAAKPAAPAAGAKPVTGAPPPTPGGPTATLKPPTHAPATTGGALGHLPKLTGVLNRNKAPGAGAAPAAPALKQSEKK